MNQPQTNRLKTSLARWVMGGLLLIVIVFIWIQKTSKPEPRACTEEAMLCPDGMTSVGRTGPNCEFAPCPGVTTGN